MISVVGTAVATVLVVGFLLLCFRAYVRPGKKPPSQIQRPQRASSARRRTWARENGFTARTDDDSAIDPAWGGQFADDANKSALDVLRGTQSGHAVTVFTFMRVANSSYGRSPDIVVTSTLHDVVVVEVAQTLPVVDVRPETGSGRLARRLGRHDIELGDDAFDDAFGVSGSSAARTLITAPIQLILLEAASPRALTLAGHHVVLVDLRDGQQDIGSMTRQISDAVAIASALPVAD